MLSANPIQHGQTKHVELDLYFVREKVLQGQLIMKHIPSGDQIVDVLTRPTSKTTFHVLRSKLNIKTHSEFEGEIKENSEESIQVS